MTTKRPDFTFLVIPWRGGYKKLYDAFNKKWTRWGYPRIMHFGKSPKYPYLGEGIKSRIQESSYVTVDITLGLPNVYWEYGYALACGKPVLVLRRNLGAEANELLERVRKLGLDQDQRKYLTELVKRHYEIAADIKGIQFGPTPGATSSKAPSGLRKQAKKCLDDSYGNPSQVSLLAKWQFTQYLERSRAEEDGSILYFRYRDHEQSPKQLSALLTQMGRRAKHLVLHFDKEPMEECSSYFLNILDTHSDVGVTPLRYSWHYLLLFDGHGYFSPDGKNVLFVRHPQFVKKIGHLSKRLRETAVCVESFRMIVHCAKTQERVAIRDVRQLNKDGFTFDDESLLWTMGPRQLLSYVTEQEHALKLGEELKDKGTTYFAWFAKEFLWKYTKYVVAFWPLDEPSMQLARDLDTPTSSWVTELNSWAKWAKKKGLSRPVDRFFVVPRDKAEIANGRYRIADDYRKRVLEFFREGFRLGECAYPTNLYVVFNLESVYGPELQELLCRNTVFFSRDRAGKQRRRGVLQYEKPEEGGKVPVLNLRYRRIPKDYSLLDESTQAALSSIQQVLQDRAARTKVYGSDDIPKVLTIRQFLKSVCKKRWSELV